MSFDISKVRPPYKSIWPDNIPTKKDLNEKYNNDNYEYQIIWSSVMGSGDFSRYIIGTNNMYPEWSGCKKGEMPIDRDQLFVDFKKLLNSTQLNLLLSLNPIISSNSGEKIKINNIEIAIEEAIGRKSEEEINIIRSAFKKSLSKKLLFTYEKEIEPYLDDNNIIINTGKFFDLRIAQRLIFSKVIELGWNPKLHLEFDKRVNTRRGRNSLSNERIGKKYQWIAYYEYMALLSDNFTMRQSPGNKKEKSYLGPWDPYIRNIDPTILIRKTVGYDEELPHDFRWGENQIFDWECKNEEWLQNLNGIPKMEDLIQIKDKTDIEWLVLEGQPIWTEPKKIGNEKYNHPQKQLWSQIKSYLVKTDEFDSFKNWALEQNFMGRWMTESREIHELFNREFYWSPTQEYIHSEEYGNTEWEKIYNHDNEEYIATVNVTAQKFIREIEYDTSKNESLNFFKPSNIIYSGMNLFYGQKEGEFIDKTKEIQCFDPSVYNNTHSYLIVRKSSFLKFLNKNNLKIVWTILGEKEIIGGEPSPLKKLNRMEISGTYFFENNNLTGEINTVNK